MGGFNYPTVGTPVSSQFPGDCKKNQCNGSGTVVTVNDDTDTPVDGNSCTNDVCTAGTPSNPPVASGTMCGTNGLCNAAGQCVGCLMATDCPGQDNECQTRTCNAGVCGFNYATNGTPVSMQTTGDCKKNQCNGSGQIVTVNDNADLPVDNNQCTSDVCTSGVPSNPPVTLNTACTQNGGSFCNATGTCVQCNAATQCAGQDTECQTRTCTSNTCGFNYATNGTPVSSQTAGDCKKDQCNGSGTVVTVNDNSDVPVDNNQCTGDVCTNGAPSNPPVTADTTCTQNGGAYCDGSGACVACNSAAQCPGTDTECQTRTCASHTCGFNYTANGTPVSSQTLGDCKKNQCNGSGTTVTVNDNTDLPVDNNQCTGDVCTNGVPTNPPVAQNTACNQNGGTYCNDSGVCVGCTDASQCPGMDNECQTRTCNSGVCGFNYAPNGTAVSSQTPGDCKKNQCNGSGAIVTVNDNVDVFVDGIECTSDICTNGVPSNPAASADTACNGGSYCDGAGACVECNSATQCPGTDTECQTRTCVSHTCGFNFAPNGTPVAAQTPGDCKHNQCNGSGAIVTVNDDVDAPDDGNQCTVDACNNGVPFHPPVAADTACNQGGGSYCDGAGACVECNSAAQCAGVDTECQTRACSAHTCGFNYAPPGTPIAAQAPGDCQQNVCDGTGAVVSAADNADLPVDNNQCTGDVCMNGVPLNPSLVLDTPCNQGGSYCNGLGACVQCNSSTQCPGTDTECQTRTCSTNTCGFNYTAPGTPVSTQTPGDCKQNQCNGSGSTVTVPFNTDLPVDNNECTADVCTNGVPTNPTVPAGTTCQQTGRNAVQ